MLQRVKKKWSRTDLQEILRKQVMSSTSEVQPQRKHEIGKCILLLVLSINLTFSYFYKGRLMKELLRKVSRTNFC